MKSAIHILAKGESLREIRQHLDRFSLPRVQNSASAQELQDEAFQAGSLLIIDVDITTPRELETIYARCRSSCALLFSAPETEKLTTARKLKPLGYIMKPVERAPLRTVLQAYLQKPEQPDEFPLAGFHAKPRAKTTKSHHQKEIIRSKEFLLQEAQKIGRWGFWYYKPDTGQVYISAHLAEILGITPQQRPLKTDIIKPVLTATVYKAYEQKIKQLLHSGGETNYEHNVKPADGKPITVNSLFAIYKNQSVVLGITQDITNQREQTEKLKRSRQKFRNYLAQSPLAIFICTANNKITYANETATSFFGKPRKALLQTHLNDLFEDSPGKSWQVFAKTLNAGHRIKQVYKLKNPGQGIVHAEIYATRLNPDERIVYVEDITPKVESAQMLNAYKQKLEEILESKTLELSHKSQELDYRADELLAVRKNLQINKQLLNNLITNLPLGIQMLDTEGNITYHNAMFKQMMGHTEFVNTDFNIRETSLWHESGINEKFKKAANGLTTKTGELTLTINSPAPAENTYLKYRFFPLIRDKQVEQVVGIYEDITTVKNHEMLIQKREALFRGMFTQHQSIMLLINPQTGGIADANRAALDFYGYSKSELLSMRIFDINTLPYRTIQQKIQEAQSNKKNVFHFRHKLANGVVKDVEVSSTKIFYQNNDVLFSIIHDITERKTFERRLKASENKFRRFVSDSPFGICLLDENLYIQEWNKALEQITGFSGNYFYNMPLKNFFNEVEKHASSEQNKTSIAELYRHVQNAEKTSIERNLTMEYPNLPHQHLNIHLKTIDTDEGRITSLVIADITRLKEAEQKILSALEKEQSLNALKTSFISMASHQLKTPLTSIQSSNDLIKAYAEKRDSGAFDKIQRHTQKISDVLSWLNQIIENFLLVSREEMGKITYKPQTVDMKDVVHEIIRQNFADDNNRSRIQFTSQEIPYMAYIDSNLVKHAIINIIANALKYSEEPIDVSLEKNKDDITLRIKDTGIGIKEEDRPHIFEAFYRGVNAKDKRGTGLGLVITKKFIEKNYGSIHIENPKDKGTVFVIQLPRHI